MKHCFQYAQNWRLYIIFGNKNNTLDIDKNTFILGTSSIAIKGSIIYAGTLITNTNKRNYFKTDKRKSFKQKLHSSYDVDIKSNGY